MDMNFEIKILEQGWLEDCFANEDLCSHGKISLVIGNTKIADQTDRFGISESALAMLRTIASNHSADNPAAERMIFHGCGTILMMGCPIGIDWSVTHLDGQIIQIADVVWYPQTDKNKAIRYPDLIVKMPLAEYRSKVLSFALQAKDFFDGVKKEFDGNFYKEQYEKFWAEYNHLLEKYRTTNPLARQGG
jgi:hypothetical protein